MVSLTLFFWLQSKFKKNTLSSSILVYVFIFQELLSQEGHTVAVKSLPVLLFVLIVKCSSYYKHSQQHGRHSLLMRRVPPWHPGRYWMRFVHFLVYWAASHFHRRLQIDTVITRSLLAQPCAIWTAAWFSEGVLSTKLPSLFAGLWNSTYFMHLIIKKY